MVVAHNSPFIVPRNIASNQINSVLTQLGDGIRGCQYAPGNHGRIMTEPETVQFETHVPNGTTIRLCHTSCDLLDAGTLESYLRTVVHWLAANPHEVIAIMMGNDDRVSPARYIAPFRDSRMLPYVYTPLFSSMTLESWPTLSEMILQNKRVIVMLDYLANQTEVPWLLDEFAYQWETRFSPTDPNFPCDEQRPPNQAEDISRNKMYMANHNLNIPISFGSSMQPILIPAHTLLEQVNAVSGNASLGSSIQGCTKQWGRPPNWLLVDYYNVGNFDGSVFQVAAEANNVSYNRESCCGTNVVASSASRSTTRSGRSPKMKHHLMSALVIFIVFTML